MVKNKNAESLEAVHTHTHTHTHTLRVFQTINEIKQIKQKGVNILSYFVLLFNRCENNLIDKNTYRWGGGQRYYLALAHSQRLSVKEVLI